MPSRAITLASPGTSPVRRSRSVAETSAERVRDRATQQVTEDLLLAAFLADLELDLAAQRVDDRGQVADPGDGHFVPSLGDQGGAAHRGGGRALGGGDRETRGDAGARVGG